MPRHEPKNTTGPVIRKLRHQAGWTQDELAVKLQLKGWDCTRSWLAKIEARQVYVKDFELLYFREIFGRSLEELYGTLSSKAALRKIQKPQGDSKARQASSRREPAEGGGD